MRLLKLSCNNPKFKTLVFKPGLNLVSGLQLSKEEKKTINGIGKSLSLKILHHIFGATFRTPDEKKLKEYLKTYGIFTLEFVHKNISYTIEKDFLEAVFYINNKKVLQKDYPSELTKIFLGTSSKISFKNLLNVFARRYGGTFYTDCLTQQGRPKEDYNQKYVNLYLLGINMELVEKTALIKTKIEGLKKAQRVIIEYEKKIQKNPKDILDKIAKLKLRKKNFIVAENYDELTKEADALTVDLDRIRDKIYDIENLVRLKIKNFDSSNNININIDQIESIYQEANFFFKEHVTKRLEEA